MILNFVASSDDERSVISVTSISEVGDGFSDIFESDIESDKEDGGAVTAKPKADGLDAGMLREIQCPDKGKHQSRNALWEARLCELKSFASAHGHCNVPQKYHENRALGGWVSRQRAFLRTWDHEESDPRMNERRNLLIGVGLSPAIGKGQAAKVNGLFLAPGRAKGWEDQFSMLLKFKETHGHVNVPQSGECRSLGRWLSNQRSKYRVFVRKQGSRDLERQWERLHEVGVDFRL